MIHTKIIYEVFVKNFQGSITLAFWWWQTFNQTNKKYILNERIFYNPPFMYHKVFLKKTLIDVHSPHLYASCGTFCVQIGQLFATQWVFKHTEEFGNRRHFPSITAICRFSNVFQRLTVPGIIDWLGRKRCHKKRKDESYQLL